MGLINNKDLFADFTKSATKKIGDGISSLSSLSPKQIHEMDEKRNAYLSETPQMTGDEAQTVIGNNLGAIGVEVYEAYLNQLKDCYLPINAISDGFDEENRIRYFDITKWVTDSEEKSVDKLINVYQVLSDENCNIALIYHRSMLGCKITLGIVNTDETDDDPSIADKYYLRVKGAIKGNFPGAEITETGSSDNSYGTGIPECLKEIAGDNDSKKVKTIVTVSNIASEKSEAFISQSMEKLLDGIVPENDNQEYEVVLLAKPVNRQVELKNRLYDLYSALSPYASWQASNQYTQSELEGSSAIAGVNASVGVNAKVSANFGASFSRSSNTMMQVGKNEGMTNTYVNYAIKHTLDVIEGQVKRIEECSALGMWEFASYVISDNPVIANNVAHMYLALTQGEESFITKSAVNFWDGDIDTDSAKIILRNIQYLQHPVFCLKPSLPDEWLMYPALVNATTLLSGKELAKALNFPRKSVMGIPVIECAPFGRDVQRFVEKKSDEPKLELGEIYHMFRGEGKPIELDINSFSSHVFITGSTGTGKTTAVLQLLSKTVLKEEMSNRHFLVVEPIKGEYKKKIGGRCTVFGTNKKFFDNLLKINPFWFPQNVHVLEHIDRFIEILNACWPMYAAMPAILKDAIERTYINAGWDLRNSNYIANFPTFYDLLDVLPDVMEDSMYSKDTKGDYAGALITRIRSLTNGLNREIFCNEVNLTEKELFEDNVIIDISRIGGVETKSLIMGIIMMKLQEYWINKSESEDAFSVDLRHITVLEEAHNLLKRASTTQTQEGSNLQGKSVEMITNAIAEMRAYGEGFIISDQAPALLDDAVIRNTNTKIVLRLPEEADRRIAGLSCSLQEKQISEIGRLPDYTAVVYQNDWVEAVLCHFDDFHDISEYKKQGGIDDYVFNNEKYLNYLFDESKKIELSKEERDMAICWINTLQVSNDTRRQLRRAFIEGVIDRKILAYNMFRGKKLSRDLEDNFDERYAINIVSQKIMHMYNFDNDDLAEKICCLVIMEICDLQSEGNIEGRFRDMAERRLLIC